MENDKLKTELSDEVLEKIKSGQVKMKPKVSFVLEAVLFIVGLVFVFLLVVFLVSFIIFVLQGNGTWFLPSFGWSGIGAFLSALPWGLVALALIFIVLIETLVERFGFAYRRPLIYSVFGVILTAVVAGILVALTPLHPGAFRSAIESQLPFAGPLYRDFGLASPPPNVFGGMVVDVGDEKYLEIETPEGQLFNVEFSTSTDFRFIKKGQIEEGDKVLIMGEKRGLEIWAVGVRKFEENEEPIFHKQIRAQRLNLKMPRN